MFIQHRDKLPLSYCSVCGNRVPFMFKGAEWHGLACSRECWRRIEYRYAVMLTTGVWSPEKENEDVNR